MEKVQDIITNETKEEHQKRLVEAAANYLDNGVDKIPEYSDEEKRGFYRDQKDASVKALKWLRQKRRSAVVVDDKESTAKWTTLAALELGYLEDAETNLADLEKKD